MVYSRLEQVRTVVIGGCMFLGDSSISACESEVGEWKINLLQQGFWNVFEHYEYWEVRTGKSYPNKGTILHLGLDQGKDR